MPKGNCNPAPELHNEVVLAADNGRVWISVLWDWDGASVYPDCAGPLFNAHAVSTSPTTWYAHYKGQSGTPRTVAIPPGTDVIITKAQLTANGLKTYADISGVSITNSATIPAS